MKVFIISIILLGIGVFGMCFNIIFRKDGKFPDSEISHNKELKKKGLMCAKAEERILWSKKKSVPASCTESSEDSCGSCSANCDNAGK